MTHKSADDGATLDNHGKQLNKNSDAFWRSRGYPARPLDWETRDPKSAPPTAPRGKTVKK